MNITDKKVTDALDKVVGAFESGNVVEALAYSVINDNRPCSKWSFLNQLVTYMSGTTDARGFRQWEGVKRNVVKGSKAIYILAPIFKNVPKISKTETATEDGKTVVIEKKIYIKALVGFKSIPVFGIESTEGEDVIYPEQNTTKPQLFEVAESFGVSVAYAPMSGGYYGYFSQKHEKIVLCTNDEKVFFHELAHAAHARVLGKLVNGQDPKQEIVAELSAAVIAQIFGRELDTNSYKYVESYSKVWKKSTHGAVMSVLSDVQKVLKEIFGETATSETEAVEEAA